MFYLVFFVCKVKKIILISQVFLKIKQKRPVIATGLVLCNNMLN